MGDTEMLLKRGAGHIRFYSPMISRGFLYACWQTSLLVVSTLESWKVLLTHNIEITSLDTKILWFSCIAAGIGSWFGYTDKTKAQFDEKKKVRDDTTHTALSEEEYLRREIAKGKPK